MTAGQAGSWHKQSRVEVIPGALTVDEIWHDVPYAAPVPCWTYITQGMAAHGQKELVISIRRTAMAEQDESPRFLLQLVEKVYELARQGRKVDAGGYTSLVLGDAQRTLGIPFHLLYLDPIPLPGIPLPAPALTVRLMGSEEFKVYQAHGAMRLISSWAQRDRYYPCPPWSEMPAPQGVSLERFQSSVLNKVARLFLPWSTVNAEGEEIVLRLQPVARTVLAVQLAGLPPAQPVAYLTHLDPRADASLAWVPEGNQTAINITPGSQFARIAGSFMLFIPEQQAASGRMFEDGYALLLPTDAWLALREAMQRAQPVAIAAAGKRFRLQHVDGSPA